MVVHGGGPQIDQMLASMGVVSERIQGLRVTDEKTMDVVEMVLAGKLNQEIVSLIGGHGGRAIGLSGKDDAFMLAERVTKMQTKSGAWVDPGRVGQVKEVRADILKQLVAGGFIPGDRTGRGRCPRRLSQCQRGLCRWQSGRGAKGREACTHDGHRRRLR